MGQKRKVIDMFDFAQREEKFFQKILNRLRHLHSVSERYDEGFIRLILDSVSVELNNFHKRTEYLEESLISYVSGKELCDDETCKGYGQPLVYDPENDKFVCSHFFEYLKKKRAETKQLQPEDK